MECKCDYCRANCLHRPGWFAPGEASLAAQSLGMTEAAFFAKYLCADFLYMEEGRDIVWLLAPATTQATPGQEYPANPLGRCVFFTEEGNCAIHAHKPKECRLTDHTLDKDESLRIHLAIGEEWRPHQAAVADLLGHPPQLPLPSLDDMIAMTLEALNNG